MMMTEEILWGKVLQPESLNLSLNTSRYQPERQTITHIQINILVRWRSLKNPLIELKV